MEIRPLLLFISEWLGVVAVTWIASLSPRLKPKPIEFRYPRREGIISFSLFVFILIGSFLVFQRLPAPEDAVAALWQRAAVAGVVLVIFLVAMLSRTQPLLSLGWRRERWGPLLRLSLALVFLTIFLRGKVAGIINGVSQEEGYAFFAWLGIALAEESVFRGYIQLRLSSWLGNRWGWVASAVLFTLYNIPRYILLPAELPLRLGICLVQGLVLGWLMKKTLHTLPVFIYRVLSEWMAYLV